MNGIAILTQCCSMINMSSDNIIVIPGFIHLAKKNAALASPFLYQKDSVSYSSVSITLTSVNTGLCNMDDLVLSSQLANGPRMDQS